MRRVPDPSDQLELVAVPAPLVLGQRLGSCRQCADVFGLELTPF